MLLPLLAAAVFQTTVYKTVSGFFITERDCKPYGILHDCGCEFRTSPKYFVDDINGHRQEILLDAVRVASYGGPERMVGQWVDVQGTPEKNGRFFRMHKFGVVTPQALQSAIYHGDTKVYAQMPPQAKKTILAALKSKRNSFSPGTQFRPYLNVLCRTADTTTITPDPASDYLTMMDSTYPRFDHYVRNMSYGALSVQGSAVAGWINLPKNKSDYQTLNPDIPTQYRWDHQKLLPDIISQLDPTVDFSKYGGINIFMNTSDDGNGSAYATYYYMTVDGMNQWLPITEDNVGPRIGALCHEDGHNFGFDHSSGPYNTAYDSHWDAMSGGYHNVTDSVLGTVGVGNGYNAYHRYKNGWITSNRIVYAFPGETHSFHLERLTDPTNTTDPLMAKIYIGGSSQHYYTVEAREPEGYDLALPSAVVIHDVVEHRYVSDSNTVSPRFDRSAQVVDPDGNGDPNDAGAQWTPGETYSDAANGISVQVVSQDATGFNVTVTVDASQPRPGIIRNGNDSGPGSFRDWLYFLEDFPTAPSTFNIPLSDPSYDSSKGFFRIRLKSALPNITWSGLTIDGASQAAYAGNTNPHGPEIMIDGTDAGTTTCGIVLTGSNQTIKNIAIGNFTASGIQCYGAANPTIQGCYLGIEADGVTPAPNVYEGIAAFGGTTNMLLGGTSAGNLLSGNTGYGASIWDANTTGTQIYGNSIGTDWSGSIAVANGYAGVGVFRASNGVTIGSSTASQRNVISGNGSGVSVSGTGVQNVTIVGNYIGLDRTGTKGIAGAHSGVYVTGAAQNVTIRGNVISGNGGNEGITIVNAGTGNVDVEANYIGTDVTGTKAVPNQYSGIWVGDSATATINNNLISGNGSNGISLNGAGATSVTNNLVGTDLTGKVIVANSGSGIWAGNGSKATISKNVFSGNANQGVVLSGATATAITNNLVGTDITGEKALPNTYQGIFLGGGTTQSVVGGASGLENVVAGNLSDGVVLADAGTTGNHVSGNFIGVTRSGAAMGNQANGVWIGNGAASNLVGEPGLPNIIGCNKYDGIVIGQAGTSSNNIRNNWIGALLDGTARPNLSDGVALWGGATNNLIGGVNAGEGNFITGSSNGVGVYDAATVGNSIRGNQIFGNTWLGIQLAGNDGNYGVTANDPLDTDSGPNDLQNFPVVSHATRGNGSLFVTGTFNGAANTKIIIDLYGTPTPGVSGYGEGKVYLGTQTVTTDSSGSATFSATVPDSAGYVSSTATAPDGSTSEFSAVTPISEGVKSLTLSPTTVPGGSPSTGTVQLTGAAPGGGISVSLSTSNASLGTVPTTVTVPSGASTATFTVGTSIVSTSQDLTVSASYLGTSQSATLHINPVGLISVVVTPGNAVGGIKFSGVVTVGSPAPTGGETVALSVDHPTAASLPASVVILAGETQATFIVSSVPVDTDTVVKVTATMSGNSVTGTFNVQAPQLTSFSISPTSVSGGTSSTGAVTLYGAAPSDGAVVTLRSNQASVTPPASITVPGGSTTASFTIPTVAVDSTVTATITAGTSAASLSAKLTVTAPTIASLVLNPTSLVGGNSSSATVTISSPAPSAGYVITLQSDASAATVPASVTIPAGMTSATFTITTIPVGTDTNAKIWASKGGQAVSAILTIKAPTLTSLTLNPSSVTGGTGSVGTVTISSGAPSAGLVISLSSSSAAATVPSTVTVAAGQTSATFTATTTGVDTPTPASLSAALAGKSLSATLTINPAALASLSLNPSSVAGGSPSTGTVTLNGPAGPNGTTVSLASNSASAVVPKSVVFAAGQTTANFSITTSPVDTVTTAAIQATLGSVTKSANLTITSATLTGISISPTSVLGGSTATGTVTLSGKAGPSGATVQLGSSIPAATVPASVMVPAGASSATFSVSTTPVSGTATASITAKLGAISQSVTLTITSPSLVSLSVSPSTVTGTGSSTGTVTINGAAPSGGLAVSLGSPNSAVSLPQTVTIPGSATSASFTINSSAVAVQQVVTITATLGSTKQTASLTILPPTLTGLSFSPVSVVGGTNSTGTVTIGSAAPSAGLTVNLGSGNAVVGLPATVTVAGGATTATFTASTSGVATSVTATISASFGGVTKNASLTVISSTVASISVSPNSVPGGASATGTVTLSGFAPPAGTVLTLSSSSNAVSVPPSVTVVAGASSATFTVRTSPVASSTTSNVTASLGTNSMSTSLTVQPSSLRSLAIAPASVVGGSQTTASGTVTLNGSALPAGATVTLSSSNTKLATIPASVKIAGGASTTSFAITHKLVSSVQTVTVTAAYGGQTQTATLTLSPFAVATLTLSPASVVGGSSSTGLVSLNAAPGTGAGTVVVKLTTTSKGITFPGTVSVPIGSISAKFTITTTAVNATSTAPITATLGSSSASASLSINAPTLLSISVSPTSVKGSSTTSVKGTVTLSGPAPTGGRVIALTSSLASTVAVPATVTIAAGKSTATFSVGHRKVTASTTVTISGTLSGVTKSTILTVTP